MLKGIGTDIVEIATIRESLKKSKRFAERVFTENETIYCEKNVDKYKHYAARFAAKEAMMKAIGSGWDNGVQWKQIEVINRPSGAPLIVTNGKAQELLDKLGIINIKVSLSYTRLFAVAIICIE